jgi:hypothetical protein
MKATTLCLIVVLCLLAGNRTYAVQKTDSTKTAKIETAGNDSDTYELVVLDPSYETFLVSQPPMNFYSESYYKNWNMQYVSIWNEKFVTAAHTGLFENEIDYNPSVNYGLELEYRLYYFFRFFEKKNHVILIRRGN